MAKEERGESYYPRSFSREFGKTVGRGLGRITNLLLFVIFLGALAKVCQMLGIHIPFITPTNSNNPNDEKPTTNDEGSFEDPK